VVVGRAVIVVTGASSGFGRLSAEALALAGHTVYASMREIAGRNAAQAESARSFARDNGVELHAVEMDVQSQSSVNAGIERVFNANGRVDVVVHNAGHLVFGPAEAFTPDQLAEVYDVTVVSTQRVNRAVLPHMRRQRQGLLLWVSGISSSDTMPYLAPYFAAKAAMDSLAVCYARELTRWGIETSIIVPCAAFANGTTTLVRAGAPADTVVAAEYETGPYVGFGSPVPKVFAAVVAPDAAVSAVTQIIVKVVEIPYGQRPFRVHIDPGQDGAAIGECRGP
jgi:NAD(P)-dependent dehydrogenase (short-subunit alcohol dehydrogenase family)